MTHPEWTNPDRNLLGFIPYMLDDNNPRPAAKQFDIGYAHGGGWNPMKGLTLHDDDTLTYPGDPPLQHVSETKLRDERILLYPHAIVVVIQPDRSFEACHMD